MRTTDTFDRPWLDARREAGLPVPEGPEDSFQKEVYKAFNSARDLLLQKHQDYGPKNIADAPGGPLNGLRVRMYDKLARINNLVESGAEPENESLRDSFMDLACYGIIGLLVLDSKWPGSEKR